MKKAILINGPIQSGKDHIANLFVNHLQCDKKKFGDFLREKTAAHFDVDSTLFFILSNDRMRKEQKTYHLIDHSGNMMSPREAMIYVAEEVIKSDRRYGKDYFGKMAAHALTREWTVISDSGFREEAEPLVEYLGEENVYHLKLYRKGFEYGSNDSRGYFSLSDLNVKEVKMDNDSIHTSDEAEILCLDRILTSFGLDVGHFLSQIPKEHYAI